jgi:hypothetical protein
MRLGGITFAGTPSELYNAIGVAMRDESNLNPSVTKLNTLVVNHCWTKDVENNYRSYYPDDVAIGNNTYRWGANVKYPAGVINGTMINLLGRVYAEADSNARASAR